MSENGKIFIKTRGSQNQDVYTDISKISSITTEINCPDGRERVDVKAFFDDLVEECTLAVFWDKGEDDYSYEVEQMADDFVECVVNALGGYVDVYKYVAEKQKEREVKKSNGRKTENP